MPKKSEQTPVMRALILASTFMHSPTPEPRRTQITFGSLSDGKPSSDLVQTVSSVGLDRIASLHPFSQQERPWLHSPSPVRKTDPASSSTQLDIVFPASSDLRDKLSQLSTTQYERQWKLSDFATFAETHVQKFSAERCAALSPERETRKPPQEQKTHHHVAREVLVCR